MAKDIEKLIEEFVIPEMEYSPSYGKKSKKKGQLRTVTIDDIPEVVLQKTKAEVYEEAKGRLKQKTSAVSRRTKKREEAEVAATKSEVVNHVAPEPAAPAVMPVSAPEWVGREEELIPFAWRMPLIPNINKPSKFYRQVVRSAGETLLPVPNDN